MNLLLLLSALLSALTGVGGTRGGLAAQPVCERPVEVRAVRAATALVARRPAQALPNVTVLARAAGSALRLVAAEPLFASRRRE